MMSETSTGPAGPDRLTLIAAAVAILLGGGNAIGIRFVVQELEPFWGAAVRFGIASVLFLAFVALKRLRLPTGRGLVGVLLYGLLAFGIAFALGFWGLVRVEAGTAMVIMSLVPLMTLFLAAAHRLESLNWRSVVGGLGAVAGFLVMFGLDDRSGQSISTVGVLALLAAAVAISEAGVIVKSFPQVHPAVENGLAMGVGTAVLVVLSLSFGESWVLPSETDTRLALLYLVVAGSVVVFSLFIFILSRWTASATSYQFVLAPFVTFPAAAWLLDERLTLPMVFGGLIVVAGVYIGALHPDAAGEDALPAQCGPDVMLRPELFDELESVSTGGGDT